MGPFPPKPIPVIHLLLVGTKGAYYHLDSEEPPAGPPRQLEMTPLALIRNQGKGGSPARPSIRKSYQQRQQP